jgi:hypothetical protein
MKQTAFESAVIVAMEQCLYCPMSVIQLRNEFAKPPVERCEAVRMACDYLRDALQEVDELRADCPQIVPLIDAAVLKRTGRSQRV